MFILDFPGHLPNTLNMLKIFWAFCFSVSQACPTLCDPMGCSTPGFRLSPSPRACSNSCPLSQWYHPTILPSVTSFSCFQSFPASGSFPMSQFFTSSGQSIGTSTSAFILPMTTQGSFRIDWLDLLAVQRTLQSLLQHQSLKASILWC